MKLIRLNEWYYYNAACGYQTKPVVINIDEISDFTESFDPYHICEGATIRLKNGKSYMVKEHPADILKEIYNEI